MPARARWLLLSSAAALTSGCGRVPARPAELAGPAPLDAEQRRLAEQLTLVRAELGDLLVMAPAAGRSSVIPPLGPEGAAAARARLDALERDLRALKVDAWGREQTEAVVWIARGRASWSMSSTTAWTLPGALLESALARLHALGPKARAAAATALAEAAPHLAVTGERERAVSIARLAKRRPLLAVGLEPAERSALEGALDVLADGLRAAPFRSPPTLSRALRLAVGGAAPPLPRIRERVREGFEAARRALYRVALSVAPDGPSSVDLRVAHALDLARAKDPWPEEEVEIALFEALVRVETWAEGRAPLLGRRRGDRFDLKVATATAAWVPVVRLDEPLPGGRSALAALLASRAAELWAALLSADRVFPADPFTTSARAHDLRRALTDAADTPEAQLLLLADRAERWARAWAELLLDAEGPEAAAAFLEEEAWYPSASASAVLRAAEAAPGAFVGAVAAELVAPHGCEGRPAAVCAEPRASR